MRDCIPSVIKTKLRNYLTGKQTDSFCCLYKRPAGRGEVVRMLEDDKSTVIVKILRCRNIKERIKNFLRISNGWLEWRRHSQLSKSGISVPLPLCFESLHLPQGDCYEVMMMEDIGEAEHSGHYLNALRLKNEESAINFIEDELLNITEKIINLGFVDIDNHLRNFLITLSGRIVRIDFELTHQPLIWSLSSKKYLQMMARLIESHVYAMQPETDRTVVFASKLFDKFEIDIKMQMEIDRLVNERLVNQLDSEEAVHSISLVGT